MIGLFIFLGLCHGFETRSANCVAVDLGWKRVGMLFPPLGLSAALQFGFTFCLRFCILRWTKTSVELDSNTECKVGFQNSVDGIAHSLACTRKLATVEAPKNYAVSILQREQFC